jgi:oxalate decarboxylase/phosphoglucose isomerase-like protein (cupin superfamily)
MNSGLCHVKSGAVKYLLVFILIATACLAESSEVAITAEPSHHLAIDNEYVRAFKVEVVPHSATLMHWHRRDYISVTIGDARISNEVEGKPPVEVTFADGATRFTPGNFAHVVQNPGDKPFRNVTFELMQDEKGRPEKSHWADESGERTFPGGHSKILFVKDGVRVSEVTLEPGATMPSHHHTGPHAVVAVSDLDLRSDVETPRPESGERQWNMPVERVLLKSGDVQWFPRIYTHSVTNTGKQVARIVLLEF